MSERIGISAAVSDLLGSTDVWDMTVPWLPYHWDVEILKRYRRAGYTFVSLTLQDWPPTLDGMRNCIDRFREMIEPEADWIVFGNSLSDIDRGRSEKKLVIGLNSQETRPIGEDLSRIETLYEMGVRHMVLAYNVRNIVADGCAEHGDAGLSNFGRQVVREMNRNGMIVDCSHTGRRSSLEAIEMSERPVIFSHSSVYSICPHFRNIRDDQIRACADRDGVIGVVGMGPFLGDLEARTESMFRHIDYIATLVGPEHVGLGTDYVGLYPMKDHPAAWDLIRRMQKPWPDASIAWPDRTGEQIGGGAGRCFAPEQIAELIELMLSRGYSSDVVKGILGANFRRVYVSAS